MYANDGHDVLCYVAQIDFTGLVPCSHEEADTCLFLHVADAVKKGYRKLLVRTVDTDVVLVAIATLNITKPDEFWVAFGTGGHFRFIPIHEVAVAVGPRKSATPPPPVPRTYSVRHRVFVCRYRKEDSQECLPRSH